MYPLEKFLALIMTVCLLGIISGSFIRLAVQSLNVRYDSVTGQ